MKTMIIKTEAQVLETMEIPGGIRKLVAAQCGEFLVIDRQFGKFTRLGKFDKEPEARADYAGAACIAMPIWTGEVHHAVAA